MQMLTDRQNNILKEIQKPTLQQVWQKIIT